MMVAILLIATVFSFGQAKQVVNKTTVTSSNPIKMILDKDEYSDDVFLYPNYKLVITRDKKKGVSIRPSFTKKDGRWIYDGLIVKSFLNSGCNENDELYFLFDDGSKVSYKSWQEFNCDNTSYFDESQNLTPLKKRIKGIKFVNGRTFESYEMTLTDMNDKNYFINIGKALQEFNNK